MRFGYQTIIYGQSFGSRLEIDRAFAFIADCGFTGIELFQRPSDLTNAHIKSCDDLLEALADKGLALLGLSGGELPERAAFLGDYIGPYLYTDTFPADVMLSVLKAGHRVAVHPHAFKPIHSVAKAQRIFNDARFKPYWAKRPDPQLLLIPDTAHSLVVWDDVIDSCRRFSNELAAVHIKGWRSAYGRMSQRYSEGFCSIGSGDADVQGIIHELEEHRYKGDPWIVVEQDYTPFSPESAIREAANTLQRWGHLKHQASLEPQARIFVLPKGPDAEFEVELQRKLDTITDSDLDGFYRRGLEVIRDMTQASHVVLAGRTYLDEFDGNSPIPETTAPLTVLAVSPQVDEVLHSPKWTYPEEFGVAVPFPDDSSVCLAEQLVWQPGTLRWQQAIQNPHNPNQNRYHLKLYGPPSLKLSAEKLQIICTLLGRYLDRRLNEACLLASYAVDLLAARAKRLDEFVCQLRASIKERCHCEEAFIFTSDPSATVLNSIGNGERLVWPNRHGQINQVYRVAADGKTNIVAVFRNRIPLSSYQDRISDDPISQIRLEKSDEEGKIFTLVSPMVDPLGKATGVVWCGNRKFQDRGIRFFHDDDSAILDGMVQAAIPRIKTLEAEWTRRSQLRKVTHELKRPLIVFRGAIGSIEWEWEDRQSRFRFEDLPFPWFEDMKSWCGIMERQLLTPDYLSVETQKIRLRIEEVSFLPDILAPIVRWMEPLVEQRKLITGEQRLRTVQMRRRGDTRFSEIGYPIAQGVHPLPKLWVDRNMFQQIFFNLIDNAIKYAKRDDPKSFSIKISSTWDDMTGVVIKVQDSGIGVEDVGNLDLLFEDGVRGESAWKQDINGTGFGLWVVRRLVELHEGKVTITNKKDPTEFTLSFPARLRVETWYNK